MSTSSFRLGHRPALDGLRGVAVLAVMGAHFGVPGFRGGVLGVDIFFVLSGFLICAVVRCGWLLLPLHRTTSTPAKAPPRASKSGIATSYAHSHQPLSVM